MKLIARMRFPYKGRVLNPGDEFETKSRNDARVLVAMNRAMLSASPSAPVQKARHIPVQAVKTEVSVPVQEREVTIDDLKTVASALGIAVDGRWGRVRLQQEIDQARKTYSTRMLKAEE